MRRGLKLVASHRCWFPKGAWVWSTAEIAEMAKEVGYEGVQFQPVWRFVWEMWRYGGLLAPREMIVVGHRDWRFDRVMEARLRGKLWWWYQVRNKEDWLFPPSDWCLRALKRFQDVYQLPISTRWFGDVEEFSPVLLELWSKEQGVDQGDLVRWLKEDSKNRGVIIDTAKFDSWVQSQGLEKERERVLDELMPYLKEVHYRVKGKYLRRMSVGGELSSGTTEVLKWILARGYRGRVIVEWGWPDVDDGPVGMFGQDMEKFKELHGSLREMIEG